MVDLMDKIQKVAEIGKSTRGKQRTINVSEVFYVWDILATKFDIMESIQIVENFINDNDVKYITGQLKKGLQKGIRDMEELMNSYGIPYPARPPAGNKISSDLEVLDSFIYQNIFEAIQSFFPVLAAGFMNSTTPEVRKTFKKHLFNTIELQELIVEYGKFKGYLNEPPVYRA